MDTRPIGICFWTCDMRGVLYQALAKCQQCPGRGQGGKGAAGGKTDMVDQGKKGFGNQKGKYGQQWQTGAAKNGRPNKGKGKAMAQQCQQHNFANEWIDEQGTKNGGDRSGWQANAEHQGQFQGHQAQQIHGIAPPHQRDVAAGVHADDFVGPELRDQGQQPIPLLTNPEHGPPPGDVSAHGHPDSAYLLWQQQENQAQQAVGEGDALSEH